MLVKVLPGEEFLAALVAGQVVLQHRLRLVELDVVMCRVCAEFLLAAKDVARELMDVLEVVPERSEVGRFCFAQITDQ